MLRLFFFPYRVRSVRLVHETTTLELAIGRDDNDVALLPLKLCSLLVFLAIRDGGSLGGVHDHTSKKRVFFCV